MPDIPPVVLTLLPADHVLQEGPTGKYAVVGILSAVYADSFPALYDLSIYVAVTDVYAESVVYIVMVEAGAGEGDELVNVAEMTVTADSPLRVVESGMEWKGLTFPRPGEYRLQARHNDAVLFDWRIMAHQATEGG